jgi:hypothetical protein
MMFKIQQLAWQRSSSELETVDFKYWHDQGWIEPKCDFFIPHQAGSIKMAAAHLTGALIARYVS